MTDKKFLSDGRKVSVLGKLNNAEWIVQEVFVTEKGDEIPSGESFTTKNIHDAPLESWLKKEEKKQKGYIERSEAALEQLRKEIKRHDGLLSAKKDMLANSPEVKDFAGDKSNVLAMFMTGTVNYLVVNNYDLKKPQKMEDSIISWENSYGTTRYESLKLASFLGKSKGEIEFRIHAYSDGSGGGGFNVFPFETYEEAVEKIKELAIGRIERGHFSTGDFDVCKELKIQFSDEIKERVFDVFSKTIKNGMDYAKKQIDENCKKQDELTEKLSSLKNDIGLVTT